MYHFQLKEKMVHMMLEHVDLPKNVTAEYIFVDYLFAITRNVMIQ